ncbi:hypothetical protein CPB83DRAFT_818587 [Crepidotus variabilis]|uniref:DUF6533 domain-containing protein n=1 Tax=Crepidotus variabilis TaxID=179855 RepID=A0A9P6JM58_9AGAR|nr:hypothetical protein CPB83DRAFT_818587 [Crepidotus variabilis]
MDNTVTFDDFKTRDYTYYIGLVSITILYYDYCLTFAIELERMWRRSSFSLAVVLFYVNRYVNIFGHIPVMLEFFWALSGPHKIEVTLLTIRVYALYERSRRVLLLLVAVILAALAVGCVSWTPLAFVRGIINALHFSGHLFPRRVTNNQVYTCQFSGLTIAWAGMLVFDIIIFLMTLYKTLALPRDGNTSLLTVLLRDGQSIPY